jgi:hypothetical protein
MKTKILIICALFTVFTLQVFGQNSALEKFFSDYLEDPSFTVVNISPKMFKMISKLDIEDIDPEVKDLINSIEGLKVLAKEDGDGLKYYKEAYQKIDKNQYEELMTVRDQDENVRIYIKDQGDIINELILLVGSKDEFVLLDIIGKIDLKTIGKLSKSLDVPGMEHLEKVGN